MKKNQLLNDALKYQTWRNHLTEQQIKINDVQELHVQRADKDGSVLYALLNVDATAPEGNKLNPICFIKGDAVSMLVVLIDEQTDDKYVLLVKQRRICDGSELFEHPAGMIDEDDESPVAVAARELGEEAQLEVKPDELKPLFDKPLFSSTSTTDEALYFFFLERRMPLADIRAFHGRQTGAEGENEHTQLHIATLPDAHRLIRNIHGIMSHLQYLKLIGDHETLKQL
jgi:8-oxo-dGTP pyrophosphatase MutT (NUDIX family)